MGAEDLYQLAKENECSECGRGLTVATRSGRLVMVCPGSPEHEGYRKRRSLSQRAKAGEYMPYVSERVQRRKEKQMEEQIGPESRELAVYGTTAISMTQAAAERIVTRIWPRATPGARELATLISVQYNLNPLNKEVYIIPFKDQEAVVLGIEANRKMARRRTPYTYKDGPRPLTAQEMEGMGEDPKEQIGVICVLETPGGGVFPGYGFIARTATIQGADKGNSRFNMASYRAERNALKRVMPDSELPAPVGMVIDGVYADVTEIIQPPKAALSAPPAPPEPPQTHQNQNPGGAKPRTAQSPAKPPPESPPSEPEEDPEDWKRGVAEIKILWQRAVELGEKEEKLNKALINKFGVQDVGRLGPADRGELKGLLEKLVKESEPF